MPTTQKTFDKQYYLDSIHEIRQQIMRLHWSKSALLWTMVPAAAYSLLIFQHGLVWVGLCLMIAALTLGGIAVFSVSASLPAQHQEHILLYLLGIIVPFVNLFFLLRMFDQYNAGINTLMQTENKLYLKIRTIKEALYEIPTTLHPQPLVPQPLPNATQTEDLESLVFDFSMGGPTPIPISPQASPIPHQQNTTLPVRQTTTPLHHALPYLRQALNAQNWHPASASDDPEAANSIIRFDGFEDAAQPVNQILHGGIIVFYVLDTGDSLHYINHSELKNAGLSYSQLHQTAIGNLTALTKGSNPPIELAVLELSHGVYQIALDHNFDASIMLLDKIWNHIDIRIKTPNGIIAAIPSRDLLLFCDAASDTAIKQLQSHITKAQKQATHPITDLLFIRKNHIWQPYLTASVAPRIKPFKKFTLPMLFQIRTMSEWIYGQPDLPITVKQDGQSYLGKILHGGFVMLYAAPNQAGGTFITENELHASGLSHEELHQRAFDHFYELIGAGRTGINLEFKPQGDIHIAHLENQNHRESSLLLLDQLWDHDLISLTPNGTIITIPSQDDLAFCDAGSFAGIEQLKTFAAKHLNHQSSGFSNQLYQRQNQKWLPFTAPWDTSPTQACS